MIQRQLSTYTHSWLAFCLIAALPLVPSTVHAQSTDVDALTQPLTHPAGIADRIGEAPAGTGLAPLAGEPLNPAVPMVPLAQTTGQAPTQDPASQRGTAFGSDGGACRDTIPGGPVTLSAYAAILLLLAGYAFMLGRKNASLEGKLRDLEKLLASKRPADTLEEKATS